MRQSNVKLLNYSCNKFLSTISNKDFFGIGSITSKDVAGSFKSATKLAHDTLSEKYKPLIKSRNQLANTEVDHNVGFGRLRFDKENIPKKHGQYEPGNVEKMYGTIEIKQQFVPDDRDEPSGSKDGSASGAEMIEPDTNEPTGEVAPVGYNPAYKIADVEAATSFAEVLENFRNPDPTQDLGKYSNQPPLTFFFDAATATTTNESSDEGEHQRPKETPELAKLSGHRLDESELEECILEASQLRKPDSKPPLIYEPEKDVIPLHELDPNSMEYYDRRNGEYAKGMEFDKSLDEKYDVDSKQPRNSMKALDYLKKVRAQRVEPTAKGLKHRMKNDNPYSMKSSIKLDSQGFRNYTDQVPDWSACRHVDILNHIEGSILYHNYEILAVNKPYGIASHEEERSREPIDMNNLVQELAAKLNIEKVYLAHRLDKTTTGVLLFATSQERARHLNKLFKSDQIKKTYWCITRGVPDPEQAIIDIPVGVYTVAGKTRSCVAPENLSANKQLSKRYEEARRAITEYKVLEATKYAALVEVKPRTGVKHQIRCHMSFGLARPILGDHKYSHVARMAPQTLSMPLLNLLHLRQPKVRTLPMHLHAKSIVIPGAKANGETLFITAPLPAHFIDNMRSLKLTPEPETRKVRVPNERGRLEQSRVGQVQ